MVTEMITVWLKTKPMHDEDRENERKENKCNRNHSSKCVTHLSQTQVRVHEGTTSPERSRAFVFQFDRILGEVCSEENVFFILSPCFESKRY